MATKDLRPQPVFLYLANACKRMKDNERHYTGALAWAAIGSVVEELCLATGYANAMPAVGS